MAAHLAGQLGLGLAHLGLDQRMPGLPHQRAAAVAQDVGGQAAGALHVVHDHRTRVALQHVGGEQHQQTVRIDVLARPGDHAQAVAVAIEGDAEVGVEAIHHLHQRIQVVRLAGVRVVVGEGAVDVAEQRGDVRADRFQHARPQHAGGAVAGIHHHLEPLADLHVAGDALHVVLADVALRHGARHLGLHQPVLGDARVQVQDGVARQGLATDHDLEAVVVGRVVAAGDGHAAAGAQVEAAEVHHRRGHQADVDDVAACLAQAGDQALGQFRARQAAVAADHDFVQALVEHQRTDRLADEFRHAGVQALPHHATDVVGAEDAAVDRHRRGRGLGVFHHHFARDRLRLRLVALQVLQGGLGGLGRVAAQAQQARTHDEPQPGRGQYQDAADPDRRHAAQFERGEGGIRHRRGDAQVAVRHLRRQRLRGVVQRHVAALQHVAVALAQCQVGATRQGGRLHAAAQARLRQFDVGDHRPAGAGCGRGQRQPLPGRGLDHARHRLAVGQCGLGHGQGAVAAARQARIQRLHVGRPDFRALQVGPAAAQGARRRHAVVGGQRGLHRRRGQPFRQPLALVAEHALDRHRGVVAGDLQAFVACIVADAQATGAQAPRPQEAHQHDQQRQPLRRARRIDRQLARAVAGAFLVLAANPEHAHAFASPVNARRCGRIRPHRARSPRKYPPPAASRARSAAGPVGRCGRRGTRCRPHRRGSRG